MKLINEEKVINLEVGLGRGVGGGGKQLIHSERAEAPIPLTQTHSVTNNSRDTPQQHRHTTQMQNPTRLHKTNCDPNYT